MREDPKSDANGDLASRLDLGARKLKGLAAEVRKGLKGKWSAVIQQQLDDSSEAVFSELHIVESDLKATVRNREEKTRRLWLELESRTKELAERNGWTLAGSWPSFMLADGVQIQFDDKSYAAAIGGRKVTVQDIADLEFPLHEAVKDLVPEDFSPQQFMDSLFSAYQDARDSPTQIPIFDLYRTLVIRTQRAGFWRNAAKERFSGLSIEQFRARLTRTLSSGVFKTRLGNEIKLFPPLDPKDGLFFFNPLDQRLQFLGRVEFVGKSKAVNPNG